MILQFENAQDVCNRCAQRFYNRCLVLSEAGELILDTENFFATNMMKKVYTNILVPMTEDDCLVALFEIAIENHKKKGNIMCDFTRVTKEYLLMTMEIKIISGGTRMEEKMEEVLMESRR